MAVRKNYEGTFELRDQNDKLIDSTWDLSDATGISIQRHDDAATAAAKTELAIKGLQDKTVQQTKDWQTLAPAAGEASLSTDRAGDSAKTAEEKLRALKSEVREVISAFDSLGEIDLGRADTELDSIITKSERILSLWKSIKQCILEAA